MAAARVNAMMALPPLISIAPPKGTNPRSGKRSLRSEGSFWSNVSTTSTAAPIDESIDECECRSSASSQVRSPSPCESDGPPRNLMAIASMVNDLVAQPPGSPRRRPLRQSQFTKTHKALLIEAHKILVEKAPQAEVAYVGINQKDVPEQSLVLSADSPTEESAQLAKAEIVFLVVEGSDDGIKIAIDALQSIRDNSASAVVVAVVVERAHLDWKLAAEKLSCLVQAGIDDAIVMPTDVSVLHSAILVSIEKAKAYRQRSADMEKKLRASRKQCDQLFWQVAHEVVQEFPEIRRGVQEIVGKKAGNIEMVSKIGHGAFADVHLGRDPKGKAVAVKVFAKENIRSIDRVLKMTEEYSMLQKMNHPNVVSAYSFVHCRQNLYIFMEMCGSSTLFKLLEAQGSRGLSFEQAKPLMSQIADGVAYMHKLQVAHCDLKPENMAMTPDGNVKIVDLGEAVDVSQDVAPLEAPKGTMPFMSPEILELSPEWDPVACDLWSLGGIFTEMLCGNNSFVKLMDWGSKDLSSLSGLRSRAGELMHIFAPHAKLAALAAHSQVFRLPESCTTQLVGGLLELCPKKRLPASQIAELLNDSA